MKNTRHFNKSILVIATIFLFSACAATEEDRPIDDTASIIGDGGTSTGTGTGTGTGSGTGTGTDSGTGTGTGTGSGAGTGGGTNNSIIVTSTNPTSYSWTKLQPGTDVFIDRSFTYSTVPAVLTGLDVLQTANNDKVDTSAVVVSFNLSADATIYVALNDLVSPIPSWLSSQNGWNLTTATIIDTDTTRTVWAKDFPAGPVSLGSNGGTSASMYTVIAKEGFSSTIPIGGGTGGGTADFIVRSDDVIANRNQLSQIDVLTNDTYPTAAALTVTILNPVTAKNGSAVLSNTNAVTYTPPTDYIGLDSFSYQVTDGVNTATATVSIDIQCPTCALNKTVTIAWNSNPTTDQVTGYKLYWGTSAVNSTTLLSTVLAGNTGSNPLLPTLTFNGWNDFKLLNGETVCIKISAYNVVGESTATTPICKALL